MIVYSYENDHPKWHQVIIPNYGQDIVDFHDHCDTMLEWVYNKMDNAKRHCRWQITNEQFFIKFRYEKDYIWFKMVWS